MRGHRRVRDVDGHECSAQLAAYRESPHKTGYARHEDVPQSLGCENGRCGVQRCHFRQLGSTKCRTYLTWSVDA